MNAIFEQFSLSLQIVVLFSRFSFKKDELNMNTHTQESSSIWIYFFAVNVSFNLHLMFNAFWTMCKVHLSMCVCVTSNDYKVHWHSKCAYILVNYPRQMRKQDTKRNVVKCNVINMEVSWHGSKTNICMHACVYVIGDNVSIWKKNHNIIVVISEFHSSRLSKCSVYGNGNCSIL